MKQWITLLAVSALFTACSKQDLREEPLQSESTTNATILRSTQDGAYVSGWEQYSDWVKTTDGDASVFTKTIKSPEAAAAGNGGLVLGFARVTTSSPQYQHLTQPTRLPFYYLPESERPRPEMYYFSEIVSGENVLLRYRAPFTKADMPTLPGGASLQNIQFQHVVFTASFLQSRGLSANTVQNYYTYDQVMALANP